MNKCKKFTNRKSHFNLNQNEWFFCHLKVEICYGTLQKLSQLTLNWMSMVQRAAFNVATWDFQLLSSPHQANKLTIWLIIFALPSQPNPQTMKSVSFHARKNIVKFTRFVSAKMCFQFCMFSPINFLCILEKPEFIGLFSASESRGRLNTKVQWRGWKDLMKHKIVINTRFSAWLAGKQCRIDLWWCFLSSLESNNQTNDKL